MNEHVKVALTQLALKKEAEIVKPKTVTYLGEDGHYHTVEEGKRVEVLPAAKAG